MDDAPESSQTATRVVLGFVALLIIMIFGGVILYDYQKYQDLINDGEVISGTVSDKQCNNHGKIYYQFPVNGKIFDGAGSGRSCAPSCRESTVGDSLKIIYATNNPNNSSCDLHAIESNINGNLFFISLLSIFLIIGIMNLTRASTRRND
ncbi:hypothetical protein [Undibacterium sp. Ren11W]|uniref:hypothetical protein n=1 Tax=Undibacterium sp. Ren11W TaxID=3413045 RepID=UPI003BF3A7FA